MFNFKNKIEIDWITALIIVCILISAFLLSKSIKWLIKKSLDFGVEEGSIEPAKYKFFINASTLIVWTVTFAAIISFVPTLKSLAYTLFAGAGVFVAILGLAAQQAFSNIISGFFLIMFKPFRVGDLIKVGTQDYGIVEEITLRHTIINNFENKRVIIPNSIVSSETIINDTIGEQKVCRFINISISYDSSIELASKIISEESENNPYCIDNRSDLEKEQGIPKVIVRAVSFEDFSIKMRAYVWCSDPLNVFQMHSDINKRIKLRFDEEGIEIPFPYRTIVYKNDLPKNSK